MILSSFFFFPVVSNVVDLELKQLNKTRTSISADKKKKKGLLFLAKGPRKGQPSRQKTVWQNIKLKKILWSLSTMPSKAKCGP